MERSESAVPEQPKKDLPSKPGSARADDRQHWREVSGQVPETRKPMNENPVIRQIKEDIAAREAAKESGIAKENAVTMLGKMSDADVSSFYENIVSSGVGRTAELKKALEKARSQGLSSPKEGIKFLERFLHRKKEGKPTTEAEDAATLRTRLEKAISGLRPADYADALTLLRDYADRRRKSETGH